MLLAEHRERALAHWLDSEQWASVLKAAVPWCVPRCAVAGRTVIQGLSLPGLGGAGAVGEGRARARGARSRSCFAGAADAESQSAAKLPAQPPPPPSSPPRCCSEGGGGKRRRRPARTTAASEGEGRAGCWAALARGGALCSARGGARPPLLGTFNQELSHGKWAVALRRSLRARGRDPRS